MPEVRTAFEIKRSANYRSLVYTQTAVSDLMGNDSHKPTTDTPTKEKKQLKCKTKGGHQTIRKIPASLKAPSLAERPPGTGGELQGLGEEGSDHAAAGRTEDSYTGGVLQPMRSPRVSYALAMATHSPWDPSPRSRFRPSRAVSGQTPVGRKEGCDGGPRPACHSTEAFHSCGRLDVLQEHACPSSSLPRPQAVSTVSSNLLPGLLFKPQVPPPSVPHRPARVSRLGTQGCGSDPLCSCRSVLPAADGSLPSSRSP